MLFFFVPARRCRLYCVEIERKEEIEMGIVGTLKKTSVSIFFEACNMVAKTTLWNQ